MCKRRERVATDTVDGPFRQGHSSQFLVEIQGWRVPVEDVPLHAFTATIDGDLGNAAKKELA